MSAFHLLKIPPESSRPEIDNAREDAGFDARESEDILQKAVDTLTAPMPRLREEVSYLWGLPIPKIDELIHLAKTDIDGGLVCKAMEKMSLPALTKANIAAHFCGDGNVGNANILVDALNMLIMAQKSIDADDVGQMINHARKKSGIVPPAKPEHVADALTKLREQRHIKSAINVIFHGEQPGALATKITEKWQFDKTASGRFVVDLIRGLYKHRVESILRPLEEEINHAADVLRDSPGDEQSLRLIEQNLSEWDEYAQPLQLIDEGKGFDEKRSSEICGKLRDLALDLHNNKGKSEISLRITKLLIKVFIELPEMAAALAKDFDALEKIVGEKHRNTEFKERLQAFMNAVKSTQNNSGKTADLINALSALLDDYAELANDEKIWNIARSVALALHNKHGATPAALHVTKELLSLAGRCNAPQCISDQLYEDRKFLEVIPVRTVEKSPRSGWFGIIIVVGAVIIYSLYPGVVPLRYLSAEVRIERQLIDDYERRNPGALGDLDAFHKNLIDATPDHKAKVLSDLAKGSQLTDDDQVALNRKISLLIGATDAPIKMITEFWQQYGPFLKSKGVNQKQYLDANLIAPSTGKRYQSWGRMAERLAQDTGRDPSDFQYTQWLDGQPGKFEQGVDRTIARSLNYAANIVRAAGQLAGAVGLDSAEYAIHGAADYLDIDYPKHLGLDLHERDTSK
ncbi:hypothetical protein [Candidatus Spongiihabitans sp.]|uniref:hypothetical protein n=1 Tax=Candidatus Spongiihabitans sp. TaxID=3101308 RepID=UPI003C7CBABF